MTLNIRHQFLVYTLGIVLAVATGLALHTISEERGHKIEEFEREVHTVTKMLSISVANDIYFLDVAAIRQKLRSTRINPAIVSTHVFDAEGAELIASGRDDDDSDERMRLPSEFVAGMRQASGPLTVQVASFLYQASPIMLADGSRVGYVAVKFSLERVYAGTRDATWSIIVATGIAILLASVMAVIAGWYFTRPILAIKDAALAVSRGALATRSTLRRTDEIGQLSDAINTMADRLVARLTEIEKAQVELRAAKDEAETANRGIRDINQNLEARVAERSAALQEAQKLLVSQERLSALGQLTATVAHELRNPLSVIQNTLYTMKQSLESRGLAWERPIARIERSIGRCNRIISDLLDYSRQRDLQSDARCVDEWLTRVVAEHASPEKIRIEHDLQAGKAIAIFDSERLRRVAVNLIDNAVQALAERAERGSDALVVVGTRATGESIEIFVRDNGSGIPPEILPRIFDPLFSTKSFGTGLGLPTVKQIIEAHGGRIEVTSEPGEGTCVRAWLPSKTERTAA